MKGKDRAELRSEAHHLDPMVHVGHQGLTPTLVASLDDALRTHELVKVKLAKATAITPREAASELAEATGSDVIQVIGRTATFFRDNPEISKKKGDMPPWRRAKG